MSLFPAYRGNGRDDRNNRNSRDMSSGFSNGHRFQRLPFDTFGHSEPPSDLNLFTTTQDHLVQAYAARQRETTDRYIQEQVQAKIRLEQERSRNGIKHVTLDDEDDPDFVPMGESRSAFDQPPKVQVIYVKKSRKRKKHKRRSSSSSSAEDVSIGTSKHKKHKRRKHDSDSESQADENAEGTSRRFVQSSETAFDSSRNPWRLLRRNEYVYNPSHMVVDRRSDLANLQYEQPYRSEITDYRGVFPTNASLNEMRAVSEALASLLYKPMEFLASKDEKCYAEVHIVNWNRLPVERFFRRNTDCSFSNFVTLSHQPRKKDDEGASVVPVLDQELVNKIDINDFGHFRISQEVSHEEAAQFDIDAQFSVLQNAVNINRHDVKAWLDFIDLQHPYHAKNECGNPKAPIQNEKAYYERVMEIIRRATGFNPASPEIQIKKLKVMEGYLGRTSDEVKKEWGRCENRFINNLNMWKDNLKMRMNDRTVFSLNRMLGSFSKCIAKLVRIKLGIIRSHPPMEGTDEFLVDMLVSYCALLIATGFIDRAVVMLQSLAEFHFFNPIIDMNEDLNNDNYDKKSARRWDEMLRGFRIFWDSGFLRIGDLDASGWCNIEPMEYEDHDRKVDYTNHEIDKIEGDKAQIRSAENVEVDELKRQSVSFIESRRRLDKLRARYYWEPVRIKHEEGKDLYEYDSRYVSFDDIQPILFPIDNDDLARELIFKLLHLFGVFVPGVTLNSQGDILRSFSRKLFPSFHPSTMKLERFPNFITNFINLMAESKRMDIHRIYPALVSNISNSSLSRAEKSRKLKLLVRSFPNEKRQSGEKVTGDIVLPVLMVNFEELILLKENADDNFPLECCIKVLYENLDRHGRSIWEFADTIPSANDPISSKRTYLIYLRLLIFLLRNLPFSDEESCYGKVKNVKITEAGTVQLQTKKELLLSIWLTGKVSPVEGHVTNVQAARERVTGMLLREAPRELDDLQFRWIGNEYEFIFELAALFCYEYPFRSVAQRYKFFQEEKPLFTSSLAKSLSDSPAIQEVRVAVLKHITHTCKGLECTPRNLIELVEKQVFRFPHSVFLLKTLLDVNNSLYQRKFLSKNVDGDELTRLIRDCGRLYVERAKFAEFMKASGDTFSWTSKDVTTMFKRLIGICKQIAEKHSDNLMPDDYIWFILMKIMIDGRESISFEKIDEVFAVGQKLCPWSKAFLFEAARNRPVSESSFLTSLNGAIGTHGLNKYILDAEVRLLITENIV
ncbi:hypothetical protein ACQ4LE_003195 [Meloidogyne hapla]